MGLIATLDPFDYEHEHRFTEHEHGILTPCQIVCDPLSRGVDSGASQRRTIEAFVCNARFWLFVVLVLSEAVLVLVIERR